MELKLSPHTTIRELKTQFADLFPHLKLEFFSEEHQQGQSSRMSARVNDRKTLYGLVGLKEDKTFRFDATTSVAGFEQGLQNEFGLSAQVFRKSGSIWLETIQTDNISLEKQNAMALESTRPIQFNIY